MRTGARSTSTRSRIPTSAEGGPRTGRACRISTGRRAGAGWRVPEASSFVRSRRSAGAGAGTGPRSGLPALLRERSLKCSSHRRLGTTAWSPDGGPSSTSPGPRSRTSSSSSRTTASLRSTWRAARGACSCRTCEPAWTSTDATSRRTCWLSAAKRRSARACHRRCMPRRCTSSTCRAGTGRFSSAEASALEERASRISRHCGGSTSISSPVACSFSTTRFRTPTRGCGRAGSRVAATTCRDHGRHRAKEGGARTEPSTSCARVSSPSTRWNSA